LKTEQAREKRGQERPYEQMGNDQSIPEHRMEVPHHNDNDNDQKTK
jgi:hypothetical protein